MAHDGSGIENLPSTDHVNYCRDFPSFQEVVRAVNDGFLQRHHCNQGSNALIEYIVYDEIIKPLRDYFWHNYPGGKEGIISLKRLNSEVHKFTFIIFSLVKIRAN